MPVTLFGSSPIVQPQDLNNALNRKITNMYVSSTPFEITRNALENTVLASVGGTSFARYPKAVYYSGGVGGGSPVAATQTLKLKLRSNSLREGSAIEITHPLSIPSGSTNIAPLTVGTILKTSMVGVDIATTLTNIVTAIKANFDSLIAGTAISPSDGYLTGIDADLSLDDLETAIEGLFGTNAATAFSIVNTNELKFTVGATGTAGNFTQIEVRCVPTSILPSLDLMSGEIQGIAGFRLVGAINALTIETKTPVVNAPVININSQLKGTGLPDTTGKVQIYGQLDTELLRIVSNGSLAADDRYRQYILAGKSSSELQRGVTCLFTYPDMNEDGYVLLYNVLFPNYKFEPNPQAITALEQEMVIIPQIGAGILNLFGHFGRPLVQY